MQKYRESISGFLCIVSFFCLLLYPILVFGQTPYEICLLRELESAGEETTVADVKLLCSELLDGRSSSSGAAKKANGKVVNDSVNNSVIKKISSFLISHNRNYVLPISYNSSVNQEPFNQQGLGLQNAEVKFQFSTKFKLAENLLSSNGNLWFGYTNLSFWQAYNKNESAPFRETNHEPEIFLDFNPGIQLGDWTNNLFRFGFVHQSNGQRGSRSRSWNRLYSTLLAEKNEWVLGLKAWYRIPENTRTDVDAGIVGDDNPDIDNFLGFGELMAKYKGENNQFELLLRNNLKGNNRLGLQVDWSFPLIEEIDGYVQFFNGYGESLIDYNDSSTRIGLGLSFSDGLL